MNAVVHVPAVSAPAAEPAPMNRMNDINRAALAQATACLFRLNDAGCTVIRIEIGNGRPVLCLDERPKVPWIKGALVRRHVAHGVRHTERIASVYGCLVMWAERETQAIQGAVS